MGLGVGSLASATALGKVTQRTVRGMPRAGARQPAFLRCTCGIQVGRAGVGSGISYHCLLLTSERRQEGESPQLALESGRKVLRCPCLRQGLQSLPLPTLPLTCPPPGKTPGPERLSVHPGLTSGAQEERAGGCRQGTGYALT